jgi:hypothetical protein
MAKTLRLPPDLEESLARESRRTGRSQNGLVVAAVNQFFSRPSASDPVPRVPATPFVDADPPLPPSDPPASQILMEMREERLQ